MTREEYIAGQIKIRHHKRPCSCDDCIRLQIWELEYPDVTNWEVNNVKKPKKNKRTEAEKLEFELSRKNYYKSDQWKEKASKARERAGNRCQLCASRHKLQVHHNTYKNFKSEKDEDLCVLCAKCHQKTHFKNTKKSKNIQKKLRQKLRKASWQDSSVILTKSEKERRQKIAGIN